MAVDGKTSPINNVPIYNKTPDASQVSSPSDDASRDSANEPEMHADVVSMTSSSTGVADDPSTTPDCDDRQQSTTKNVTSFPLVDAGGTGTFSFGESHVTRLESFVESLTGPSYSQRKSTTVRDWTNALTASSAVVPNSTTSRNGRSHDVTGHGGSSVQPLDLSLKAGVCSNAAGEYRSKSNISQSSTPGFQSDFQSKSETQAGVSEGLLTTLSAAAAAGFPFGISGYGGNPADMWLAHWVAMATAAAAASANLFNQIPGLAAAVAGNPLIASSLAAASVAGQSQSASRDQRRTSPSVSARRKDIISASRSPHLSPSARRTPNTAHSGDVRNHIRSPIQDGAVHTSSPSFTRTSKAMGGVDRRRSEVTSSTPQTGSAFSLYERSPTDIFRKEAIGRNSNGCKPGAAALSAIESFVENSFGSAATDIVKQRRHLSSNGRHFDDVTVHGQRTSAKRRYLEDRASSSGDDEPSSRSQSHDRDQSVYIGSGGRAKKSRHVVSASGDDGYRQHFGGDATSEREVGKVRTGTSSVEGEAETSTSPDGTVAAGSRSLEYLQCLAYSRPIDSEHPLESLEKLVHVQQRQSSMSSAVSPPRRPVVSQSTAAVQQRTAWTPRTKSPYRHDDVISSPGADETVNGDQVAVAESTGSPDSHMTNCRDDSIVETTTSTDDIRDMTSSAIFSRSPATSAAAAVSLVC